MPLFLGLIIFLHLDDVGWGAFDTQPAVQPTADVQPEVQTNVQPVEELSEAYIAVYTYASDEPGDLTFEAGQQVTVVGYVFKFLWGWRIFLLFSYISIDI